IEMWTRCTARSGLRPVGETIASSSGCQSPMRAWVLWRVPLQRIDFLAADIASHDGRVVRRQSAPGAEISFEALHAFQAGDFLQLAVGNSNAEDAAIFAKSRIEVNPLAVARPIRITDRAEWWRRQSGPAFLFQVIQDEAIGVQCNRGDRLAVRRWTWRKVSLALGQVDDCLRRQIENRNARSGWRESVRQTEDNGLAISSPARIETGLRARNQRASFAAAGGDHVRA